MREKQIVKVIEENSIFKNAVGIIKKRMTVEGRAINFVKFPNFEKVCAFFDDELEISS